MTEKSSPFGKVFRTLKTAMIVLLLFAVGFFSANVLRSGNQPKSTEKIEASDIYWNFVSEAYDKIKENYWEKTYDDELTALFKLASEKLAGPGQKMEKKDKDGLKNIFENVTKGLTEERKKEYAVNLVSLVLGNLQPFGRSGLYTKKDESSLINTVNNINPDKDLYEDLGVGKEASQSEIKKAFENKSADLKEKNTPEAKEELKKIEYSYKVLNDSDKRKRYDSVGAEPTVFSKIISPKILHIYIKRFSPTTFEEFQKAANGHDGNKELDTLILDLRGNIGGAIDFLPYLLGPFIGQNQYAYELLHQGEQTPIKTQTGALPSLIRYKKMVLLTDNASQSTAELMAAVIKRYNVGVLVGTKTKGWGTIEKVFEMKNQLTKEEKYSLFIVHTLTLRDDNLPIEGNGVIPLIDITEKNWEGNLSSYYNSPELNSAVKEIWENGLSEFN